MTLSEKLVEDFKELTEIQKKEVVDFVGYLKEKRRKEVFSLADKIMDENAVALKELSK